MAEEMERNRGLRWDQLINVNQARFTLKLGMKPNMPELWGGDKVIDVMVGS